MKSNVTNLARMISKLELLECDQQEAVQALEQKWQAMQKEMKEKRLKQEKDLWEKHMSFEKRKESISKEKLAKKMPKYIMEINPKHTFINL